MKRLLPLSVLSFASLVAACGSEPDPPEYGPNPQLAQPQRGLLPAMEIADPTEWRGQRPIVPPGYSISAIARGLGIPRQTLVLPNGDILIAEGRGGGAPKLKRCDCNTH